MKRNDYQVPAMIIVTLQTPNPILIGSPDAESAGVENYIEQPGLTW